MCSVPSILNSTEHNANVFTVRTCTNGTARFVLFRTFTHTRSVGFTTRRETPTHAGPISKQTTNAICYSLQNHKKWQRRATAKAQISLPSSWLYFNILPPKWFTLPLHFKTSQIFQQVSGSCFWRTIRVSILWHTILKKENLGKAWKERTQEETITAWRRWLLW